MVSEDYVRALLMRVMDFKITNEQKFELFDAIAPVVEMEYKAGYTSVVPQRTDFPNDVDHLQNLYHHFTSAGLGMDAIDDMFTLLEPITLRQLFEYKTNVDISPVTSEELISIVNCAGGSI